MLSYLSLAAISYIAGIFLCDFFPKDRTVEIWAVLVIIEAFILLAKKSYRKHTLTAILFLSLGFIGTNIASNPKYNDLFPLTDKYITIEGYVCDLPEKNGDLYSYSVKTTGAEYMDKEYPADEVIRVSSYVSLNYGANIRVKGFIEEFSDKKNSSDFNVKRYYQSRGIFYKMYARELTLTGLHTKDYSLSYWINLYKSKLSDAIDTEFSGNDAAILKAIATGNKRQFSPEFKSLLINTGTMKFFYPSFLHIYIITALVGIFFGTFKKNTRVYILMAFMIIYAAINSHSPVFVKNALLVIIGGFLLKKFGFTHYSDMISITILTILFSNPLYCFDVGFVISVASGLMMYYFSDIIQSLLSFIPWRRLRHFISFYIITTIGLLPILTYYFNGINLYTNLLAPIYTIAVTILIFLTLVFWISGGWGWIISMIASMLWYFRSLPVIISKLPFSQIWIKPMSLVSIAAFFGVLYIIYQIYMGDFKKRRTIVAIISVLGLSSGILISNISRRGTLDITFVNVGQGDGAIIHQNGGETILIDGGGKYEFSDYDAGEQVFLPYLADNGYFNIDKAIVSHYHSDHVLGITAAVNSLNVKELIMPDYGKDNIYRRQLEALANQKNIPINYVKKGDIIYCQGGIKLSILSPSSTELLAEDENNASIVALLEYNNFKCLFTGDIDSSIEKKILNDVPDCDVVKVAHHGSAGSSSTEFTNAVKAEHAIASLGKDNIYAFPKPIAIYNYQQSGAKFYRTDINGDITVSVNNHGQYKIFKKEAK